MSPEVVTLEIVKPDRLVELEREAKRRLLTPDEMREMRDLGASVRAAVDQVRAELQLVEDGTER